MTVSDNNAVFRQFGVSATMVIEARDMEDADELLAAALDWPAITASSWTTSEIEEKP